MREVPSPLELKMLISLIIFLSSAICPGISQFCNKTKKRCCVNYLFVNGACRPCYGSWGINCTKPCRENFYGFGCSLTCTCGIDQICHRKVGCINKYTEDYPLPVILIAVGGVLGSTCLIITCFILYKRKTGCRKRSRSEDNMVYHSKIENVANIVRGPSTKEERSVQLSSTSLGSSFDDLYMNLGVMTPSNDGMCERNLTIPKENMRSSYNDMSCSSLTQNKGQNVSTRTFPGIQSVRRYGRCQEFQDNYDHLDSSVASVHSEKQPLHFQPRQNLVQFSSDKSNMDDGYVSFDGNIRSLPLEKRYEEHHSRPYSSVNFDR